MGERQAPARRGDFAVFRQIATRWSDNDLYGHLNNVVHYALFDTAVNGWLIEGGLLDPHHGPCICLVAESGCRYHAELAYPDLVTAGLRVGRVGSSSIRYEIGLFRNDSPVAAAEGFFVHVHVDRATRRPRPLPDDWRAALSALVRAD